MIFSSKEYVIFLAAVLFLLHIIKGNKLQKGLLIVASYFFYCYWDWRFGALMLFLSASNYYAGLRVESARNPRARKGWMVGAIGLDLLVLGIFKYCNFFISNLDLLLSRFGVHAPLLDIVLPVGISFIVFEVISYVVDIARKESSSAESLWDLALLVAFFPHLVAGPILKPKHFLPQIGRAISIKWSNIDLGLQIFVVGLLKKVLVADNVAPFVDKVFQHPQYFSSGTLWLAVIAYAIQIYADFSGYSDMAIGSAKCMGLEIPRNFNFPYVSKNVTEFWRRWHISLSTWLREYLYIALGGNRRGKRRQYVNLMAVMLLGGLWHGASWNFVVWGGMHGLALAVHKMYAGLVKDRIGGWSRGVSIAVTACSWALTMVFVLVTWVFFRSASFETSAIVVSRMFALGGAHGIAWAYTPLLIAFPFVLVSHWFGNNLKGYPRLRLTSFGGAFVFAFALLGLLFVAPHQSSPFIYFQF